MRSREPFQTNRIVLVGNPNVGKSALFGALTGHYVTVSNYPGTTVELTRGHLELAGARARSSTRRGPIRSIRAPTTSASLATCCSEARPRAVLLVGDAKNVERTLLLALQLAEMELPLVVALNMWDEATERALVIDAEAAGPGARRRGGSHGGDPP